ncbi:anti-sigma factor [Sphingomonas populi]|uniref:Anti-sigma factor n=1 Tax=Sphingomonas populi TaxID=2484750 RepID=A0A4Q6Y5B9_9SPHN|nr:zf-HC2 domain-containing protein [Sphingomonas populi]RZF64607.1 anti-sigma factor [Sphingomonas populi]
MSGEIDPEMLMAYADGELDPLSAKRVERAIAGDPQAAATVARHRALRATLARAFDPVAAEPVPKPLLAAVETPKVVDLASVRAARRRTRGWSGWPVGGAIAASLALGLFLGGQLDGGAPVTSRGGALIASGSLDHALNTQLAATQDSAATTRVRVTFRDRSGTICRTFATPALGGIACRDGDAWVLRETRGRTQTAATEYRQAGSDDAAIMADAEAAMSGEPLDAAAEARARAIGWRSR